REYYITATADSGSTISPSGVVIVSRGNDQTFVFEALPGHVIVEVWIDGLHLLHVDEMELGTFTFTRVMANHTIMVKSINGTRTDVILRIDVMEGQGHAEYEVDGSGTFIRYTGVVILPAGTDLVVVAYPDELYLFDRWETPAVEWTEQISFTNLRGPLHLEVYFIPEDSGRTDNAVLLGILGLLIIASLFILLFLLWIRSGLFLTITKVEAVKDASVTYRIEYQGAVSNDIKLSNSRGKLRIAAKKRAIVTISMAAKDGSLGIGMPLVVVMENRREYREIILK
ncbi:MAG: hypothetical protein FWC44_02560, partial [Methanomassiliicoccaceae archaeon]|nr:hypothetical protein [Methanomassiliicoccaceae archaeon]